MQKEKIANDNKDVSIEIHNETVCEKYMNDIAFYGISIGVFYKNTRSNVTRYYISCFNALRSKVVSE